jgi:glutamate dehydrogenase (NAD(P)+)
VNKEQVIRTFARAIKNLSEYSPGPDMGTDESSMAYVYDETSRAVGLPRETAVSIARERVLRAMKYRK